jgi:hypothetical protein
MVGSLAHDPLSMAAHSAGSIKKESYRSSLRDWHPDHPICIADRTNEFRFGAPLNRDRYRRCSIRIAASPIGPPAHQLLHRMKGLVSAFGWTNGNRSYRGRDASILLPIARNIRGVECSGARPVPPQSEATRTIGAVTSPGRDFFRNLCPTVGKSASARTAQNGSAR